MCYDIASSSSHRGSTLVFPGTRSHVSPHRLKSTTQRLCHCARYTTISIILVETRRAVGALKPMRDQHASHLVNGDRRNVHTAYLDQLPGTVRPPKPDDPLGKGDTIALATARYKSLKREGATAGLSPSQSSWVSEGASRGLKWTWRRSAPAAMQSAWTHDTPASVPGQEMRRTSASRSST